jgi:predicted Zn-dependent peptidase
MFGARWGGWGAVLVVVWAAVASGQELEVAKRASSRADLTPRFERYVTSNGLVVLLSPDEKMNGVVVDLSFSAGALHQPKDKGGLAHLTEHVIGTGLTTDYRALLEGRGGIDFNAFTTLDRLNFTVLVPPEELPLALWVNADRMGTSREGTLDADALRRHQRLVAQERVHRVDDAPYGGNAVAMMRALFPLGHPLRSGVIGSRDEIHALTPADVMGFARQHFVPANGVLTLVGRFEPAVAKEWISRLLEPLPRGTAATSPAPMPGATPDVKVTVTEELGRRPKISFAWALDDPRTNVSEALQFGSLLLSLYTDGFAGMNVSAAFVPFVNGGLFVLEVTSPHVLDKAEAIGNAEVVYRYLAQAMMPKDIVAATLLAWDRALMARLHTAQGLASLLVTQETLPKDALNPLTASERHWALTPDSIQAITSGVLKGPRVVIYSKPTRPLPRKELK